MKTEIGRFGSNRRAIVGMSAMLVTALVLIWFFSDQTEYDEVFSGLTRGVQQDEIERLLGPGQPDPPGDQFNAIVGFRSVDSLPLGTAPPTIRLWWHDGEDRYLYVDFAEGRLYRAALFGPSREERRINP